MTEVEVKTKEVVDVDIMNEETKDVDVEMVDEKTKEVVDVDSDLSFLLSSPDKLDKTEGNLEEAAEIILV